ncbi:DnaJ domain-containing protein [bacterium]|nr:DnaJ domain-containing protein [bacterium]
MELYELKSRYRELARIYHPDKGGSSEEMQQLNTAYRIAVRYMKRDA